MPPQDQNPLNPEPQQPITPPQAPQPMSSFPPQPPNPQFNPNPVTQPPLQQPMPAMQPLPDASKGNKKLIFIILGAVAAVLLIMIVGVVLLMAKSKPEESGSNGAAKSNASLETFSNPSYSVLIPKGYTQKETTNSVEFTETGEAVQASKILTSFQKFPRTLTSAEVTTGRQTLKTRLQDFGKTTSDALGVVKDIKVVDFTFKGQPALKLTGTINKDNAKTGDITLVAVVTDKELYVIGVAAHAGDPQIFSATNEIIDSFTLKQSS